MYAQTQVPMTCPSGHLWEAWLELVASHGTVFRPEYCPVCGQVGKVVPPTTP